jgi:hypothetical protein
VPPEPELPVEPPVLVGVVVVFEVVLALVHGCSLVLLCPALHVGGLRHGCNLVLFCPVLQYGGSFDSFAFAAVAPPPALSPITTATSSVTSVGERQIQRAPT